MIKKLFQNIIEGSVFAGLEIISTETGEGYYYLELKKNKSEIVITKNIVLKNLDEIALHVKPAIPLFICANNDIVLTKKLSDFSSTTDTALVNEAFPNLDITDFYWELMKKSNEAIISIARIESINLLIQNLKARNIHPYQISLGLASLNNILPYLKDTRIALNKHSIQLQNSNIVDVSSSNSINEKFYNINGLSIANHYLLIFAQILGQLNQKERYSNLTDTNLMFQRALQNKRIFQIVGKASLVFFCTILLINFIGFNHYFTKVNELNTIVSESSSEKDKLISLEKLVKLKEDRLETISNSSNSKTTYYLDVLGQLTPTTILLSNIQYQPLLKRIQEKKPIRLENEIILIAGLSQNINEFSKWIEKLESLEWIKSIETLDYDYVTENTSDFLIEINTND